MNQNQYNQLFSFIWNIANDVLVQVFNKGDSAITLKISVTPNDGTAPFGYPVGTDSRCRT